MALAKISVVTKAALQKYHNGIKNLFVAKEAGKGLSTNDYTNAEKQKLAGIAEGAEVNVQADWNATEGDALILNKPTKLSEFENDEQFITLDQVPDGAAASDAAPLMDGTASAGSSAAFARGDHRHPTDTSRAAASDLTAEIDRAKKAEQANSTAAANAQAAAEAAQSDVNTVKADYLKAADKAALQGNIDTLAGRVTTNEGAITTLNGNSSVAGSVDKKIADAINAFATQLTDDGTVNTYKEAIEWIATHGGEYTTLLGAVNGNAAAIEALEGNTYNSENLVEITDSEIDAILAS